MKKSGNSLLFFGSKKCISCLCLEEKVIRLGIPKDEIVYLDINIDHEVFSAFGVRVVPTLMITSQTSGDVKRLVGDVPVAELKQFLRYK